MKRSDSLTVKLRGHHVRLIESFYFRNGKERIRKRHQDTGYGKKFIKNIIKVLEQIGNRDASLEITEEPDDICKACKWKSRFVCRKQGDSSFPFPTNAEMDRDAAQMYGFKMGKTYSARYVLRKLHERKKKALSRYANPISF